MDLKLYVIPGSHPCATVEAALDLKGLHYERVDLLPGLSAVVQLARFHRRTVPGLVVDGHKVSGSRLILSTLDGLAPQPRLCLADPAVEEADRWGHDVLQEEVRFISLYALTRSPQAGDSYLVGANVPRLPAPLSALGTRLIFGAELRLIGDGPSSAERALRDLPSRLDRIDELIESDVIGAETPNAADLQIAGSVRLLLTLADLRDAIDARPAGRLARRLIPRYPGDVPSGTLPAGWLQGLERPATAAAVG